MMFVLEIAAGVLLGGLVLAAIIRWRGHAILMMVWAVLVAAIFGPIIVGAWEAAHP